MSKKLTKLGLAKSFWLLVVKIVLAGLLIFGIFFLYLVMHWTTQGRI